MALPSPHSGRSSTPLRTIDRASLQLVLAHQLAHASFDSPRPWIYEGVAQLAQAIEREHQLPIADDVDGWDVVAEASIRTISGKLRLTTPEGDDAQAPAIPIPPGSYRVRVYYGQLHSVVDELAPHGADIYRLLIWPAEPSSPRMLKGETSGVDPAEPGSHVRL